MPIWFLGLSTCRSTSSNGIIAGGSSARGLAGTLRVGTAHDLGPAVRRRLGRSRAGGAVRVGAVPLHAASASISSYHARVPRRVRSRCRTGSRCHCSLAVRSSLFTHARAATSATIASQPARGGTTPTTASAPACSGRSSVEQRLVDTTRLNLSVRSVLFGIIWTMSTVVRRSAGIDAVVRAVGAAPAPRADRTPCRSRRICRASRSRSRTRDPAGS